MIAPPEGWLRAVGHQAWPAGSGVLVRTDAGEIRLVPSGLAVALARCAAFAPAEQHAARLGPRGAQAVAELLRLGLLERVGELRARLLAAARPDEGTRVSAIAIPTRGASPMLARLVSSLGHPSVPIRIYVDDPDPSAADRVRRDLGGAASVAGAAERADLLAALGEGDGPAARFALEAGPGRAWRIGAVRNWILLDNVGRSVLSLDDDLVAEGFVAPGGARLGTRADPTELVPCATRSQAWQGATPLDLPALHGAVLGRGGAGLVAAGDLTLAGPALCAAVEQGARVVVTAAGLAGDSGTSRASSLLALPPEALRAMLVDYPARVLARAVRRAAPVLSVSASTWFMSPCFAFDGTALLPPFFPRHRATDGLWGACLQRWVRPGLLAHLPVAVRHDPGSRAFAPGDFAGDIARFRMMDLLAMHLAAGAPRGGTPEERLVLLGDHLESLAGGGPGVVAERVQDLRRGWLAGLRGGLEEARAAEGPPAWQADLDAAAAAIDAALAGPPAVEEHAGDAGLDVEALRAEVRSAAAMMRAWPALVRAARRRRPAGVA